MMVSLTPAHAPKAPRPIKLEGPVEFESLDHMLAKLKRALHRRRLMQKFQKARVECRILRLGPKNRKKYKICPEQDCENLVFNFNQTKSMIGILELEKVPEWIDRIAVFKGWYKYTSNGWTWESSEQDKSNWHRGSSKRSQSVPSKLEERTNPIEQALPLRDIGDANVDPDFLYPASEDKPCPVAQGRKMSKQDANQYVIQRILSVFPDLDKKSKDPRVYCACCDINNHPRFACNHYYKHQTPTASTSAHCAWARILLFYALELKPMVASPNPIGLERRSSLQLTRIESQLSNGIKKVDFHLFHLQSNHLKMISS